jgi:hypothetical protein
LSHDSRSMPPVNIALRSSGAKERRLIDVL